MPDTVTYSHAEPYISVFPGDPPRPRLPVTLEYRGRAFTTVALVDSGADVSAFHTAWAHLLGAQLHSTDAQAVDGIGGMVAAWYLQLHLVVGGRRFPGRIACTDAVGFDVGILGRDSFFLAFAVGIDEAGKRVLYRPLP